MKQTILVVDDEESIRFSFKFFIEAKGYSVFTAADYSDAKALIDSNNFDLMFIDIFLQGNNGLDLLKIVKSTDPSIPVVMITGGPSVETATEAIHFGAMDYIVKPILKEPLLRVVEVALDQKREEDEKKLFLKNIESVLNSVKDGIIALDSTMVVLEINGAASSICCASQDRVMGKHFREIAACCQGGCLPLIERVFKTQTAAESCYVECRPVSGKRQVTNITVSPLLDGRSNLTGVVMVVRDETRLFDRERRLASLGQDDTIIGKSHGMSVVRDLIADLAHLQTTVLITGESGTGKELVVDALHQTGSRRDGPLIKINCTALAENLLESELFGHVAGAFTGAIRDTVGRFQLASGGTIFLDEIGDISPRIQVKLLRVIETMTFERVGDSTPICADFRLVTATNRDLGKLVDDGMFRKDLFYRLKVVEIRLPPLRERRDDILLLVDHFLVLFNRKFNRQINGLSTTAESAVLSHGWPGNIRELENAIEHAFVRCRGPVISLEHLPSELVLSTNPGNLSVPAADNAKAMAIMEALKKSSWNKSRAADLLGISRRTLYRKMEKYAIDVSKLS